jgi:hypothetical protein
MKRLIKHTDLPSEAWQAISETQQSYIDEFSFYQTNNGIEAWYAGEWLATWDGLAWDSDARTKVTRRASSTPYPD